MTGPDGEDVEVTPDHLRGGLDVAMQTFPAGWERDALAQRVGQAIANAEARGARAGYDDGHRDGKADAAIETRRKIAEYAAKCREDAAKHATAAAQHLRAGNYSSAGTGVAEAEHLRRIASAMELIAGAVSAAKDGGGTRAALAKAWAEGYNAGDLDSSVQRVLAMGYELAEGQSPEPTRNPYA